MMKQQAFLDATKKVKIQTVIEKLKKDATFRDGHWSSSEYFERDLKQKGIIPPIEIHHQYKFPKGFSEKTFEDHVMWLEDLKWFEPERILDTNNYVDRLTAGSSMSKEEIQDLKKQLSEPLKGLNDNEKQEVIDILSKQQLSADEELKQQINAVQKLNPELQDIKIPAGKELDFLIGVTSGFHYDDIKYFLSITDFQQARTEKEKAKQQLGMNMYSLFMEPGRMQKIIDATRVQMNMKSRNFNR